MLTVEELYQNVIIVLLLPTMIHLGQGEEQMRTEIGNICHKCHQKHYGTIIDQ
jgi:hypothetical protein